MSVKTIVEPSTDKVQEIVHNNAMRQRNTDVVLATGQKMAVVLVKLAGGVDQPGDYPALKAAREGMTTRLHLVLPKGRSCDWSLILM